MYVYIDRMHTINCAFTLVEYAYSSNMHAHKSSLHATDRVCIHTCVILHTSKFTLFECACTKSSDRVHNSNVMFTCHINNFSYHYNNLAILKYFILWKKIFVWWYLICRESLFIVNYCNPYVHIDLNLIVIYVHCITVQKLNTK